METNNKKGDCFEANAKFIINLVNKHNINSHVLKSYKLCHGIVHGAKGSPVEKQWFPHCWIEINKDVILDCSNGKRIIGLLDVVRYRIKEKSVKRYTPKQAIQYILNTDHYGEWEKLE